MTPDTPVPVHIDTDPEAKHEDSAISPSETDAVPGASKPLDDTPVPPLTEPADTNGG